MSGWAALFDVALLCKRQRQGGVFLFQSLHSLLMLSIQDSAWDKRFFSNAQSPAGMAFSVHGTQTRDLPRPTKRLLPHLANK